MSVMVQVYVPADKLEPVEVLPPDGDHEYTNDPAPPVADTTAWPLLLPLHNTLLVDDTDDAIADGSVMVAVCA